MRAMSPLVIFSKTGAGFSSNAASPSQDPNSRTFKLVDAVHFSLVYQYTKGTSGETSMTFGVDTSWDGGTTWARTKDAGLVDRAWTRSISESGVFFACPFGDIYGGTHIRWWAYVTGTAVASTSLTLTLCPMMESM